jgi:HK97 family phage major capsid protein
MKTLQEILARKAEIRSLLEGDQDVDLTAFETELRELDEMQKKIETRQRLLKEAEVINKEQSTEARTVETFNNEPEKRDENVEASEKRGKDLKENRSVTVGASSIVLPSHYANNINPTFNQVSTLLDRVRVMPMMGGESFKQPYVAGYGEGDYTAEGADYTDAEPTFGYADVVKSKITAYAEDTEEVLKLPAADYDSQVVDGVSVALRKKISRQILIGAGGTNKLAGIFSAAATAIDPATDLAISTIDNKTLDEIIYSFGGSEDVEDAAVLIMNKKDLKAFAQLRDNNGNKLHTIVNQGNTGTIDGIPFLINSACKAITDGATAAGEFGMAYGPLSNYCLCVFSDTDIQRSTDYKFKQGMIAHKGVVFAGGNVVAKNGFLRVKKAPVA